MKSRLQFGLIHDCHSHTLCLIRLRAHAIIKYHRQIHSIKVSSCGVILMTPLTQHAWNGMSQQNAIITNSTFALTAVTCRNVCREKKKAAEDTSVAAVATFLWVRFWKVLSHNSWLLKKKKKKRKRTVGLKLLYLPLTSWQQSIFTNTPDSALSCQKPENEELCAPHMSVASVHLCPEMISVQPLL